MALKQYLTQKTEQRLSPQQIQLMKLLQVPTLELDQRIKQELEENPALEEGAESEEDDFEQGEDDDGDEDEFDISDYFDEDVADYKTQANNASKDDEERVVPLSGETSFQEKLSEQLHLINLDDDQFLIADVLIGNLDESGYLSRNLDALVDDLAFSLNIKTTEAAIEVVLLLLQSLDPAGIGARNLRECLLIQINRRQDKSLSRQRAKTILELYFEEFTKKHYEKIAKKLAVTDAELKQ